MKNLMPVLLVFAVLISPLAPHAVAETDADPSNHPPQKRPRIEVAILLDTSGSMSGLIDQAQTRLWNIVNQTAIARKHGKTPDLRVALYEYGKSSLPKSSDWIRRITKLTGDLDRVSAKLFELSTNGGEEYCGTVIQRSLDELNWTDGNHYKAIFIAGNEPFTQGSVDYRNAVRNAVEDGIVVNTIHCGSERKGRDGKWAHAASIADGRFLNINQNEELTSVDAPQDDQIRKLNKQLNNTYIPYGKHGQDRKSRQVEQDKKAGDKSSEAEVQRALVKWKKQYSNSSWDLIDALDEEKVDLSELDAEQLPEKLQKKSPEERKAYIQKKKKKRKRIQEKLKKLEKERREYVKKARQKQGETDTFGSAVQNVLNEQLNKNGFSTSEDK